MNQPVQVTYVCKKCHASFVQEKLDQPPRSFIARMFGLGKSTLACPKCGATDLAEADSAPLTTRAYRKKQQG